MEPTWPNDTRGIVDPGAMAEVVDFTRHPPGDDLDGIVEWFWSVAWALPDRRVHDQQVLNHPAGNVSIGTIDDAGVPLDPPAGRVYGVQRSISHRRLTGSGWTVAARTTVGGLGVVLDGSARAAADRQLPLASVPGLDADPLVAEVAAIAGNPARVDRLRVALAEVVGGRDPALVAEARDVAGIVGQIEHDRTLMRVEQVAELVGVSVRSLQRLFDRHVGASPSFVIRRWRIIEAAEAADQTVEHRQGWRGWAAVAAELGYADQAHLTRDFTQHLGLSPTAYVARNRQRPGPSQFAITSASDPLSDGLPDRLAVLAERARAEGIRIVDGVIERWTNGSQRFDQAGEVLLLATDPSGRVVGIGGITQCPTVSGALRVRRFYVDPDWRRRGLARSLASALLDEAWAHTDRVTCNAGASDAAAPFWEALGFEPVDGAAITHILDHSGPAG